MKLLVIPFVCAALLSEAEADDCNDRCTLTQVCGSDGKCFERSQYVKCPSWGKTHEYYCKKGHSECCDSICMPLGSVCCGNHEYCPNGYTCCTGDHCCPPGSYCNNVNSCSKKSSLLWWHGVIIIVAVAVFVVVFVVIWRRRRSMIIANNQPSGVVMVNNPGHTMMQSTNVVGHTNGQPQNVAFVLAK
ncbi:SCO-spondin-like isoform X2 [Ruditapes philippinarum]|uniref:SCO-spondin-like isoform X2 n=1 Tax=Ruditapes philippinarum TaxID=129788 RepID=UPI00295B3610|nr:SCO-spondin-like isoform X2 [Ruditapes philippinarum]